MSDLNNNDLAGYPLVLALNENAINNCLAVVSERTIDLPDYWHLTGEDDDSWALNIDDFDAPQIDFNTSIRNGCRLKMTVKTGNFTYDTIKKRQIVTESIPLAGVTFFITTEVSSIEHTSFDDELFQVQSLFADLTRIHDVTLESMSQEIKAKVDSTIEVALVTLIQQAISIIAEKNPQALLFGTVKIPTIAEAEKTHGPLAPTACSYSVTKCLDNGGSYIGGALNYLLWLDEDPHLPKGDAVGAFSDLLLLYDGEKQQYAPGTFVISDYALLEKVIKPSLIEKYTSGSRKPEFEVVHRQGTVPAKLHLKDDNKYIYTEDGDDHTYFTKINMQSSSGQKMRLDYEMDVRRDHWSGDIFATGKGYADLTFDYVNGELTSSVNAPNPDISIDRDATGWFTRVLGDIITLGFDEIGIDNREGEAKDIINSLGGSQLGNYIKQVLDLIELPGKKVFVFDQAVMNGNLYIRTRYDI